MNWIVVFLFLTGLGTAAWVSTVPGRRTSPMFFRLGSFPILAAAVIGSLVGWSFFQSRPLSTMGTYTRVLGVAFVISCLLMALMVRLMGAAVRNELFAMPAALGAAFVGAYALWHRHGWTEGGLLAVHLLSSAAVLGGALVAALVAGVRTVDEGLPGGLTSRMTRVLVGAMLVKVAVSGALLGLHFEEARQVLSQHPYGILAGVRIAAGLAAGLVLAMMAHSRAKRGSHKAAAILLGAAAVVIVGGELSSIYLSLGMNLKI